jgi:hypothetical protein
VVGGGGVAAARVVGGVDGVDGLEPQPTEPSTGMIPNSRLTRREVLLVFVFFVFTIFLMFIDSPCPMNEAKAKAQNNRAGQHSQVADPYIVNGHLTPVQLGRKERTP